MPRLSVRGEADARKAASRMHVTVFTTPTKRFLSLGLSVPAIVPEVLSDIEKGGEEAVSITEEMVTNPGGAVTVIDGGVKSVWADVTNGAKLVLCDKGIGDCPSRTLASSCAVLATVSSQSTPATVVATTTARVPTTSSFVQESAVITTSSYVPVETSYFAAGATLSVHRFWSRTGMSIFVFMSFALGFIVVH